MLHLRSDPLRIDRTSLDEHCVGESSPVQHASSWRDRIIAMAAVVAFVAIACRWASAADELPVLDAHTHFYDPTRPQGVPWPGKDSPLYRKVMPEDYSRLAAPLGVSGTVVVEASPWVDDNRWLLDLSEKHSVVRGVVAHLVPGSKDFAAQWTELQPRRLLRGLRPHADQFAALLASSKESSSSVSGDLRQLAAAKISLDVQPRPETLRRLAEIDGLATLHVNVIFVAGLHDDGPPVSEALTEAVRQLQQRAVVFGKVIIEPHRIPPTNADLSAAAFRPAFQAAVELFGADRMFYGSNWPVSEQKAPLATLMGAARELSQERSREFARQYLSDTAGRAYHLPDRSPKP